MGPARPGRQREPHLSPAEAALAGRNLTILIYQIDKILSLQLGGYVINCVLITAAATSSECSNLRRNRGRRFKFVCVNSASTNSAACAAPGAALPVPGARPRAEAPGLPARLALVASGNPSGGRALQETLPQTHRPRLVHPAAGLSPAPQTLLAEKGLKEGASPAPRAVREQQPPVRVLRWISLGLSPCSFMASWLWAGWSTSASLCPLYPLWLLCWEARLAPSGSCRSAWYFKNLCNLCCCSLRWLTWLTSWELLWTSQRASVFPAEVPRAGSLWVHLGTNHLSFATFPAHPRGCQLVTRTW